MISNFFEYSNIPAFAGAKGCCQKGAECLRKNLLKALLPVMKRLDYGYTVRKLQAEIICGHLASCKEKAILDYGDFNDINGSTTLRAFYKSVLKDAWWKKGLGFGFTFHGMGMRLRLNHALYFYQSLSLHRVYKPISDYSDHNSLIIDISFIE